MNPFKDSIPEEREKKTEELLALLRQGYRQEQQRSWYSQQEKVTSVGVRLAALREESGERTSAEVPGSFAPHQQHQPVRRKRIKRVLSTLAAILVIGTLIGGAIVFLTRSQTGQGQMPIQSGPIGKAIGPVGKPITVTSTSDGLAMSMSVTPGPYFLGELLAVNLSLTNHTHPMLIMQGWVGSGACESAALYPEQAGGTDPRYALYTLPVPFTYNCPMMGPGIGSPLAPGQTVAAHFYIVVKNSGDVTLVGKASFYLSKASFQGSPGPLAGHLPMLHMQVEPQTPTDRMISLQQKNTHVAVDAPAGLHLMDQTYILCQDSSGHAWPGGYEDWEALSSPTLQRPECSGIGNWTITVWKYAIGAAGYAVTQGQSSGS